MLPKLSLHVATGAGQVGIVPKVLFAFFRKVEIFYDFHGFAMVHTGANWQLSSQLHAYI